MKHSLQADQHLVLVPAFGIAASILSLAVVLLVKCHSCSVAPASGAQVDL